MVSAPTAVIPAIGAKIGVNTGKNESRPATAETQLGLRSRGLGAAGLKLRLPDRGCVGGEGEARPTVGVGRLEEIAAEARGMAGEGGGGGLALPAHQTLHLAEPIGVIGELLGAAGAIPGDAVDGVGIPGGGVEAEGGEGVPRHDVSGRRPTTENGISSRGERDVSTLRWPGPR
jgi:hypothetical protein